jgi:hypothetical protein
MNTLSIRSKVIGLVLLGVMVMTAVVGFSVVKAFEKNKQTLAKQSLAGVQSAYRGLVRDDLNKLGATCETMINSPTLLQAFRDKDHDRVLAETVRIYPLLGKDFGITHVNFMTADRKMLLRMTKPPVYGDVIDRVTLLNAERTQQVSTGLELGRTGFNLRYVKPVRVEAQTIGYLEVAEEINSFATRLKEQTGAELGVLLLKTSMVREEWAKMKAMRNLRDNWDDRKDVVMAQSTTNDEHLFAFDGDLSKLPQDGLVLEQIHVGQSTLMRGIFPIADVSGKTAGALFILRDITELSNAVNTAQLTAVLITLGLGVILCVLVWLGLDRLVFRRLTAMSEQLELLSLRVAGGDFDIDTENQIGTSGDEIGRLEQFLAQFLKLVGSTLKSLCGSSDGG